MADPIKFFYNPRSRARIAHWGLEEIGAPYEFALLDFDKKEHKTPEFLKLNPMGKIPAIVHRGQTVTEAAAILTYLGDAFPEQNLAPRNDDPARAKYLRMMFFVATCFEAAVMDKINPRTREIPMSAVGWGNWADVSRTIEEAILPGPYVLGDTFTMVDVLTAAQLGWSSMMKWIELTPSLTDYVKRCHDRPAQVRADDQSKLIFEKMQARA